MNSAVMGYDRTEKGDETYTPFYAVEPILKYIPKGRKIWCPFDGEWSAYYRLFKERGYDVVQSSLAEGKDFFTYTPEAWDIVVSNPPFSKKDQILERLYGFGKPFALLLPLAALQGMRRYQCLKKGVQILAFDKRICYYHGDGHSMDKANCPFPSAYFCRGLLPESLVLEELTKYERPVLE